MLNHGAMKLHSQNLKLTQKQPFVALKIKCCQKCLHSFKKIQSIRCALHNLHTKIFKTLFLLKTSQKTFSFIELKQPETWNLYSNMHANIHKQIEIPKLMLILNKFNFGNSKKESIKIQMFKQNIPRYLRETLRITMIIPLECRRRVKFNFF